MTQDRRGLYGKFIIEKADGSPLDPRARYFVLNYGEREDGSFFDPAARIALLAYSDAVRATHPALADELRAALDQPMQAHSHEERSC